VDATTDRRIDRPGVVDQVVDVIEPAEDVFDRVLHRCAVGDVAGERVRLPTGGADFGDEVVECFGIARQRETVAPRWATAIAEARPMPLDAPVMMTCRPTNGPAASPPCPVGIEVLGPVLPQLRRIRPELRNRYPGARSFPRILRAECGHQVDDIEDLGGNPQLRHRHIAQHLGASGRSKERRRGTPR
jgi:hypothetical protein